MIEITLPKMVADLVWPEEPEDPYRWFVRPGIGSIDDALAWLKLQDGWPAGETNTDGKRREIIYLLLYGRYLRAEGLIGEGRIGG